MKHDEVGRDDQMWRRFPRKRTAVTRALGSARANAACEYRETLLIRNRRPPQAFHRALGIVLLQVPGGLLFFMGEGPL